MKRVAIVGAGLAGLSAAWHLLDYPNCSVTLFDPKGIGNGASGVSTGLLHPYPGKLSLKSWGADLGMESTLSLIDKIEEASKIQVADRRGILRLAVTGEQQRDFKKNLEEPCEWWPSERVVEMVPMAAEVPALWIPHGITVYTKLYLEGLWRECSRKGALHVPDTFSDVKGYDAVILAAGYETLKLVSLPLKVTRGQTLLCRWPPHLPRTPFTLLSQGHLTPTEDSSLCQIGSTYENPESPCSPTRALDLREKIALFYPPAQDFKVVEIKMGYRIGRDLGYRPIVAKIDPKTWVFTGLGSRGLLYHAWLGRALAEALMFDYETLRPEELYKSVNTF